MTTWNREETLTTSTEGALQLNNTLTVGVDSTGYDVKFFGDSASNYMLWDTSGEQLRIVNNAIRSAIVLENTDDGATNSPGLQYYRNSSSAAADDTLGVTTYLGRNADNNADVIYGRIQSKIVDPTTGGEEGKLSLGVIGNGSFQQGALTLTGTSSGNVDVTLGHSASSKTTVKGYFAANNQTPAAAPDWTVSNKTGTSRALDANGALADIGDRLAQLVDDLISIGILQ